MTGTAGDDRPPPEPYHAEAACCELPGCFRMVSGAGGGPTHCPAPVRWAGTFEFGNGEVWRAMACDGHHHGLTDPHPLTDDDRAYLEGLQHQHARALAGKPYARPLPLRPGRPQPAGASKGRRMRR